MTDFRALLTTDAQPGRLDWIGLRPARRAAMQAVQQAELTEDGLVGDRARAGKRAVTLIQAEHFPVIAALAGRPEAIEPERLRRNLVVSGINLTSLKGGTIRLGEVTLEITGVCAPCSRMQKALGLGGYNAMRGHGGWCARVLRAGCVRIGDSVTRI